MRYAGFAGNACCRQGTIIPDNFFRNAVKEKTAYLNAAGCITTNGNAPVPQINFCYTNPMNKIYHAALGLLTALILLCNACKPGTDAQALRHNVLQLHDEVMEEDGKAMNNKMALDSLGQSKSPQADTARQLSAQLGHLNDHMMDWMHQFDPEQKGKPAQQVTAYFSLQQKQLTALDSSYKALLSASGNYLKAHKIAPTHNPMPGMKM